MCYLKSALLYSASQLNDFFKNPLAASCRAADRDFEAKKDGVTTSGTVSDCDEGVASVNGMSGVPF